MSLTRRRFLQASTLAATSPLWATRRGVSAAPRAAQGGTITAWGFEGGGVTEGMQSQVDAFKQKNPDVTVDVQTFPYADVHTNLLNAIIAGTGAPDLCSIDDFFLTQYTDGLVDQSAHRAEYEDQFVPPTLDVGSYQGKLYGLAGDAEPIGLFYRQDLWDQYGIKEDDIKTWADLAEAGNKVNTDSNGEVYLYGDVRQRPLSLRDPRQPAGLRRLLLRRHRHQGHRRRSQDGRGRGGHQAVVGEQRRAAEPGWDRHLRRRDDRPPQERQGDLPAHRRRLVSEYVDAEYARALRQVAPDARPGDQGRGHAHRLPVPDDPGHRQRRARIRIWPGSSRSRP